MGRRLERETFFGTVAAAGDECEAFAGMLVVTFFLFLQVVA